MRGLLIVSEIALAMMLLVGGSLLIHSFTKLASVESGYDPENVLTFQVSLADLAPGTEMKTLADDVVEQVRLLPGVKAAAFARQLPLIAIRETAWFRRSPHLPNPPPRPTSASPDARLVSEEFFDVMGIRVVAGRAFGPNDGVGQPRVLLINQTLARQEFPNQNPIGQYVYAGRDSSPWQIVGIVADVRQFGLDQDPQPQFFADFRQWSNTDPVFFTILGPYFAIRGGADVQALVPRIRDIVRGLSPDAGLYNVATMEQLVSNSLSRPRMYADVARDLRLRCGRPGRRRHLRRDRVRRGAADEGDRHPNGAWRTTHRSGEAGARPEPDLDRPSASCWGLAVRRP